MSAVIVQCTCLLAAIALPGVTCIDCRIGWFGDRCQFKCHCATPGYCGLNGECPGGEKCEPGYFGVGCQYVDLAYLHASPTTARYLYDHDERSCNPDSRASSVSISLSTSMPASFFRITVRDYSKLLLFTLAINKYSPCVHEKRHVVTSFIVDVVCEEGFMIRELVIRGQIAPSICSVYISGGRNIALGQFANQSSTYWRLGDAKNAVDGVTDGDFERGSCARTNSGEQQRWTLYFDREIKPLRAVLYNSDVNQLYGFTVKTFNSKNDVVHVYVDSYRHPQPVYDVTLISIEPIVKLEILGNLNYPVKSNAIHFCEIEVFGDYRCPGYQYGLDCSKQCQCNRGDSCSQMTGVCTLQCALGRHGQGCRLQCSSKCVDGLCEPQSGVCYHCTPGNVGEFCSSETLVTSQSGPSYMWSMVPIVMGIIITPVVIYVCLERKKENAQTTNSAAVNVEQTTEPTVVNVEQTTEPTAVNVEQTTEPTAVFEEPQPS